MAEGAINVKAELSESMRFLNKLGMDKKRTGKVLMKASGQSVVRAVKKNYSSVLHKRTGHLYRTIHYKVGYYGQDVIVTAHNDDEKGNERYGFILSHGAIIYPKKKKTTLYIKDLAGNILARSKRVELPPKDFMEGPGMRHIKTNQFKSDIQKATKKQVEKLQREAKKK